MYEAEVYDWKPSTQTQTDADTDTGTDTDTDTDTDTHTHTLGYCRMLRSLGILGSSVMALVNG